MNLILLLAALRVWAAPSSTALLTRIFLAVSLLSVEIQLVTWLGAGSLQRLPVVNLAIALAALVWSRARRATASLDWGIGKTTHPVNRRESHESARPAEPPYPAASPHVAESAHPTSPVRVAHAVPWPAVIALGLAVVALNLIRPLEAADPYHLDKVAHIERTGSWVYDVRADKKINVLSNVYELVLADLDLLPAIGPWLVRLHGVGGLFLYLVAIASARELLRARGGWPWAALLVLPVVFHQLVLIKNDLFVAIPGFVVLAWVVGRSQHATTREYLWAGWLAAFTVAVKLTNLPLLVIVGLAALFTSADRWRDVRALAAGSLAGLFSGGLIFILIENVRWYGDLMPVSDISSRYATQLDRLAGISRFGLSLFDLGLVTRVVWPGRGGWGGTFGLPFVWAIVMLLMLARSSGRACWTLVICAFQFLAFAVVFPDADVAQRLALAPALLAIAVALSENRGARARPARLALVAVIVLSAAQIARSGVLYLVRDGGDPQAASVTAGAAGAWPAVHVGYN